MEKYTDTYVEEDKTFYDKSLEYINKRAWKNGAVGELTAKDASIAYEYFRGKCAYSGIEIINEEGVNNFSLEHIIPIMSGGHSMAFNCIPVCKKYNSSKSGYHLLDWWQQQSDGKGNSIYNPYRLLKLVNYIMKSLNAVDRTVEEKESIVLTKNSIDIYLDKSEDEIYKNIVPELNYKTNYKNITPIKSTNNLDMKTVEESYTIYENIGSTVINPAIFLAQSIDVLKDEELDKDIILKLEEMYNNIGNISRDGKVIFSRKDKEINTQKKIISWLKQNNIENIYGIAGYMNSNIINDIEYPTEFLDNRKAEVLKIIGAEESNLNTLLNKVPNLLVDLDLENQISILSHRFDIGTEIKDGKSSEMYKYIIKKPELILSKVNVQKFLRLIEKVDIDKRMMKKGIDISTMTENITTILDVVKKADLKVSKEVRKRIVEKFFNNSNGNLIEKAYKSLRDKLQKEEKYSEEEIELNASRWLICMSEKYNASEVFKENRANKTKSLYKNMEFDEDGYMKGVNRNAYIVPQIIAKANLDISKEAEAVIIDNIFNAHSIKRGESLEGPYIDLKKRLEEENPEYADEALEEQASRWIIFLSENSDITLDMIFDERKKHDYMEKTKKYYQNMKFDSQGNYINQKLEDLNLHQEEVPVGKGYMKIINSFFKAKGEYYNISGRKMEKEIIQKRLLKELEGCQNKKQLKEICIRIRRQETNKIKKEGEKGIESDR